MDIIKKAIICASLMLLTSCDRPASTDYPDFDVDRAVIFEHENALEKLILREAVIHKIHPLLIRAVIKQESNFRPKAISYTGCCHGLMQVHEQHLSYLNYELHDLYDTEKNLQAGVRLLAEARKEARLLGLSELDGMLKIYFCGSPEVKKNPRCGNKYLREVKAKFYDYLENNY